MSDEEKVAVRTVLEGFDQGIFIRDTSRDHEPGWGIKLLPYLRAMAVLQKAVEP